MPDPIYKIALPHHAFPGAEKPYSRPTSTTRSSAASISPPSATAWSATRRSARRRAADFANSLGKGGAEFPGPWGVLKSRNITSSKTAGIGDWTDAEIKTRDHPGQAQGRQQAEAPMGFQYYVNMTDQDLDAVVAYLRTVPAKD